MDELVDLFVLVLPGLDNEAREDMVKRMETTACSTASGSGGWRRTERWWRTALTGRGRPGRFYDPGDAQVGQRGAGGCGGRIGHHG